jgi:hypothetical protein
MKKIIPLIAFLCSSILLSAQNKNTDQVNDYLLYGGIAIIVLVAAFFVYRFFKSTAEKKSDFIPFIKGIYPNPSHGPITIEIRGKASQLKVFDTEGQQLGAFAVIGGDVQFDLSSSPRGNYIIIAYYGATQSNAVQFTLQ